MSTGELPFRGDTSGIIFESILNRAPTPAARLNPDLPAEIERIMNKALEKDRDVRYQHASDIRADLKRLKRDTDSAHHSASSRSVNARTVPESTGRRKRILTGVASLLLLVLALGAGYHWRGVFDRTPKKALTERQLTHNAFENRVLDSATSPDGKNLVYVDGKGLHISAIATGESHDVSLPPEIQNGVRSVRWYPDGEKILLNVSGQAETPSIWAISIFGGTPRKLRTGFWALAISPRDSSIVISSEASFEDAASGDISIMEASGENIRKILAPNAGKVTAMVWSPDGRFLAFILDEESGGSLHMWSLEKVSETTLRSDPNLLSRPTDGPRLEWLADGRLLFAAYDPSERGAADLWGMPMDLRTGKAAGSAVQITNWHGDFAWSPSASSDGRRLTLIKGHTKSDAFLSEMKDKGRRLEGAKNLTLGDSSDSPSAWFADSRSMLITSDRTGRFQIYRLYLDGRNPEAIVPGPDDQSDPQISPDDAWIIYWFSRAKTDQTSLRMMRVAAAGGTPEQILESPSAETTYLRCPSRAGKSCVLSLWKQNQVSFYEFDAVKGQGKELTNTHLDEPKNLRWSISPDGSQIAMASRDRLTEQIRVVDLLRSGEKNVQLPKGWSIWDVGWTSDSAAVLTTLFSLSGSLARVELDGQTKILIPHGTSQFFYQPLASPDGRYIAYGEQGWNSNVWLLENY